MLTEEEILSHELFDEIAELVLGVKIESLPESQQIIAIEDVKNYIKDFLVAYVNDTFGKFPAIRVEVALTKDKSVYDRFPETLPQLKEAFLKLVKSV